MRRGRRAIGLAALALLGFLLAAGTAGASTWTATALPDGGIRAAFYGVSCPSPGLCVAVGGNNTIASTARPAGGTAAWSMARPEGSRKPPPGLPPGVTYGGGQIRGVSCPSTGFCAAASFEGDIFSSANPTGAAAAWKVVALSGESEPRIHMGGISCPSPALCVAVALGGKVVTSTAPAGDRAAWTVTQLPQPFDLRGVDCPAVSLCVAVGNEGSVLVSTNPTGGPLAWTWVGKPGGELSLNGVDCPSPALCVTGNAGRIISSTNPTDSGSWQAVAAGTGLPVKGVSCPSDSACAAVDNNSGISVSTDPTGGSAAWSFQTVLPFMNETPSAIGNGMFGISCPAVMLCVAVGQDYQVISSTDPFARDWEPSLEGNGKGRSKRPRAVITRHPPKRLERRRGGVRVRFRFRSVGKAKSFQCKIAGGRSRGNGRRSAGKAPKPRRARWHSCESPRRYRVGRGKHVFRVRAIGPSGIKGPRASFHFRVGRLIEPSPVGSCPKQPVRPTQPCVTARA